MIEAKLEIPVVDGSMKAIVKENREILYSPYDAALALKLENPRAEINNLILIGKDRNGKKYEGEMIFHSGQKCFFADIDLILDLALIAEKRLARRFLSDLTLDLKCEFMKDDQIEKLWSNQNNESRFAITQIAKRYGMSAEKLNHILSRENIQYKVNDQWVLNAKYQDKGYTVTVPFEKDNVIKNMHTYWSSKGVKFIHALLIYKGYLEEEQLSIF